MNEYPRFIEVNNAKYEINTDFRIALECDEIWKDNTIGDYEKILAVIYKLLGEKALDDIANDKLNVEKTLNLVIKYLQCGKNQDDLVNDEEPTLNFKQDIGYIRASFMSDYNIDLDKEKMHWWEFNDLLQGLTEDTILNRVRYVRQEPLKDKKGEELNRWIKIKKQYALKKEKTPQEIEMDKLWEEQMRK